MSWFEEMGYLPRDISDFFLPPPSTCLFLPRWRADEVGRIAVVDRMILVLNVFPFPDPARMFFACVKGCSAKVTRSKK